VGEPRPLGLAEQVRLPIARDLVHERRVHPVLLSVVAPIGRSGAAASSLKPDPDKPEQARGRWLSVCHDLSLYLADLIITRHPHLHWKLHMRGKRNLSYQRPVLVGFRNAHSTYTVNLYFALTQYAGGLVRGEQEDRDFFVELLRWPDKVA
jgi:hypothetical protein